MPHHPIRANRLVNIATAFSVLFPGCFALQSQSHLAHRLLTIPVEINGVSGAFLIDTGSDGSIVDAAFARQLGLRPSGTVTVERNYSAGQSDSAIAARLRIGPQEWKDISLATLDLSAMARTFGLPILGVVGTDLLASMRLRLSYSTGTAQAPGGGDEKGFPVALTKVGNRYFVPVRIGESAFELLLDSGANMTAVSSSTWRALPPSLTAGQVEGILSSGNPPGSFLACLPALLLGRTERSEMLLRNLPLRVIAPSPSGSFADARFGGILGGDILERFDVTLDLERNLIYLRPDARFQTDANEFVSVGIQFAKAEDGVFSVASVWKPSPAEEAGVEAGDRIRSVNGHSSAGLGLEEFASQLHGAVGKPVALEVERAAGKVMLHMQTRQLVCGSQ